MIARLKSIARAVRIALARKLRRPGRGDLLLGATAVLDGVLQARRALAVVGAVAVGWRAAGAASAAGTARSRARSACAPTTLTGARRAMARRQRARGARPARDARCSRCATGSTPAQTGRADRPAPLQSVEGLSLGVDLTVRYALDPRAGRRARRRNLPDDLDAEVVEPAVQGVIYKVFARYTVREIFSTKRARDPAGDRGRAEAASWPPTASCCASVQIGKVDLPADYRRGMEGLLAEELETEKMQLHAAS